MHVRMHDASTIMLVERERKKKRMRKRRARIFCSRQFSVKVLLRDVNAGLCRPIKWREHTRERGSEGHVKRERERNGRTRGTEGAKKEKKESERLRETKTERERGARERTRVDRLT